MDTQSESARFWEDRYGQGRQWSGRPNGLLVEAVGGLDPGTALDLGCGEGGDAIWLATQGWTVTAVDIASSALSLGAQHAADANVGDRITWEQHELGASFPNGTFDLVSACYLHSPVELARDQVLRQAAEAVAPGGHLVIVGHAGAPSWSTPEHPLHDVAFPTTEEVLAGLQVDPSLWEVVRAAVVTQPCRNPDGEDGTRPDNVLHLQHLPT